MSQLPANVNSVLAISEPSALATLTESFGSEQFSVHNLPQVNIPRESIKFTLETDEGEQDFPEIRGVILEHKVQRAYWSAAYGTSVGTAPDCQSSDGKTGAGTPGGACVACPWNQFGTAAMGNGKACRESRVLFFLLEGDLVPSIIKLPPSAIKPWMDYQLSLLKRASNVHRVITSVTLERVTKGAQRYIGVNFRAAGKLGEEDLQAIAAYRLALKPLTEAYDAKLAETNEGTNFEVPQDAVGIVRDGKNNPFGGE